ncbi:rhamnulokinase [Saccharothrix coeruleofusca]|uniref:rhamnulokinase n=1 Tax=Saccharothrix coeruleofusca TaxID=33919 RepID=UPI001AE7CEF8|nr:rhamnulokinase family protein [Saccharothrix coeruleofusca]MBP2333955.1 rhamnulokinase [Saccharothrix coeruleofusca]
MRRVAAVDLGASSGRVVVGEVGAGELALTEVHRFPNGPVRLGGTLHWDVLALYRGVLDGLRAAGDPLASVGIDSWAVDYGLLDRSGALLGNPVHYRDSRTEGVAERVLSLVDDLYATTGVQVLPFNTLFQLVAAARTPQLSVADRLLLIPDLLTLWLTGDVAAERTNASTTQLLDIRTGRWATGLMERVGVDPSLFPPLCEPGDHRGDLLPAVLAETGLTGTGPTGSGPTGSVPVHAVGSHDTASAVVGVPAEGSAFGYISCGTWSLVGVELDRPVLTEESRRANFTNEAGVDGTIRYLRNVMGLWLLQESLRAWPGLALEPLLAQAASVDAFACLIDPDAPEFLAPDDGSLGPMPDRIAEHCLRGGRRVPTSPAEVVRCVLDSLALAYRDTLAQAQRLSGKEIEVVHLVGGGARNGLLCQLTADVCGLPVVAGPVEATALGNVLVQARAIGAVHGTLADLRALLRTTQPLRRYTPS